MDVIRNIYYGETIRLLPRRLEEHKSDIRYHRIRNMWVNHVGEKGHLQKWSKAKVMQVNLSKQHRKAWESMYIHYPK